MRLAPFALIALLLALVLPAGHAQAHGRSVSYSSWTLDAEGADVSLRLKLLELRGGGCRREGRRAVLRPVPGATWSCI